MNHPTTRIDSNRHAQCKADARHDRDATTTVDAIRTQFGAPALILSTEGPREVCWRAVHDALWPVIARAARHGALPLIGTPAWTELPDGDPRRVGSIYLAASLHALTLEADTAAAIDASHEIAAAAPWGAIAKSAQQRNDFRRQNPDWAIRRPA